MLPHRRSLAALVAALALASPATALAQSAGDDQYEDPFGDDQGSEQPSGDGGGSSEPAPAATPEPGTAAPAQAAPSAPVASAQDQLPYTGSPVEAALLAAAGTLLVAGGVTLRVRLRERP